MYILFGEWNGIQNFAAPAVFAFLFDKLSFLQWMTVLLSYQRFYIPMFLYFLLLMYIGLLIIKAKVQWDNCTTSDCKRKTVKLGRDFLLPLTIRIHKWLLTFITIIMFIYILKSIYIYMYRTSMPLMTIYMHLFQVAFIAGIVYVYLLCDLTIPLIKKGVGFDRAQKYFHKYLAKHWKFTMLFYANQFLLITLSILLFKIIIDWLVRTKGFGFLAYGNDSILFKFVEVHSTRQLISNIMILPVAFVFSNILYAPIMLIIKWMLDMIKKQFQNI